MPGWAGSRRLDASWAPAEWRRAEATIAHARLFCAAATLLVAGLDPPRGLTSDRLVGIVMAVYLGVAAALWLGLRTSSLPSREMRLVVHGIDLLWASALTGLMRGPSNPFFLCFLFPLLTGAYRWSLTGALGTAACAIVLLSIQMVIPIPGTTYVGPGEVRQLMMRSVYLLIFGGLLGYLAREESMRRTEAVMATRLLARIRAESSIWATFEAVAAELLELLSANAVVLVFTEVQSGRAFLWTAEWARNGALSIASSELAAEDKERFRVESPGDAWLAVDDAAGNGPPRRIVALDGEGRRVGAGALFVPREWIQRYDAGRLLGVTVRLTDLGRGQLLVFNPRARGVPVLRLLQRLATQVAPAMYSVYLLRRLRTRIGALERGRIARELHDGVIQALIAAGMQLDVLKRQPRLRADVSRQIAAIQDLIVGQVRDLRDLTQQLEPPYVSPNHLLQHLQALVERFERETGIAARFTSDIEEVTLSPPVCHEVSRITQEALVNVRKHSGAANVLITFTSEAGAPKLLIDNDGRGFDFTGRLSHADLDRERKGPIVLKSRVRAMGGELTIESHPDRGVRLEITLPPRAVARQRTA
jgi:signal transduction histidine kinase